MQLGGVSICKGIYLSGVGSHWPSIVPMERSCRDKDTGTHSTPVERLALLIVPNKQPPQDSVTEVSACEHETEPEPFPNKKRTKLGTRVDTLVACLGPWVTSDAACLHSDGAVGVRVEEGLLAGSLAESAAAVGVGDDDVGSILPNIGVAGAAASGLALERVEASAFEETVRCLVR